MSTPLYLNPDRWYIGKLATSYSPLHVATENWSFDVQLQPTPEITFRGSRPTIEEMKSALGAVVSACLLDALFVVALLAYEKQNAIGAAS